MHAARDSAKMSPMTGPVTPAPDDVPASAIAQDVDDGTAEGLRPPLRRSRIYGGAFADAILPGLGHLASGRPRLGAFFLAPILVLLAIGVALVATTGRVELAARLVNPSVLQGLLILEAFVLVWRLAAVVAGMTARSRGFGPRASEQGGPAGSGFGGSGFGGSGFRRFDAIPIALLLAFVIVPQAWLGYVTAVAHDTAAEVFVPETGGVWHPSPPPATPLPSGETPAPATPSPTPAPATPRITVLLIGMDSGVGRQTALTDTMIVASLDPVGRTVSMVSVPRDLVDAPLPGGGVYSPKINSLATYAQLHPAQFPGSNGNGQGVLAGTIGELLGIQIDYWAQVNLGGFLRLVDTLGGVDVTVAHSFCDPGYDEYGQNGFAIAAGRWHLNGSQALAYARVRKAAGESDFTRAARQQEVLVGMRDAIVRGGFLNDPVGFLQALGQTVLTDVPPDLLPKLTQYVDAIGRNRVYRAVINHPLVKPGFDVRGSIQIPDIPGIRALAASMFPAPGVMPQAPGTMGSPDASASATPEASAGATDQSSGPAPKPASTTCRRAPTPRPSVTPGPTPAPSASPSPGGSSPEPSGSAGPSESAEPSPTSEPTGTPGTPPPAEPTSTAESTP